jgi:hypothetical protein
MNKEKIMISPIDPMRKIKAIKQGSSIVGYIDNKEIYRGNPGIASMFLSKKVGTVGQFPYEFKFDQLSNKLLLKDNFVVKISQNVAYTKEGNKLFEVENGTPIETATVAATLFDIKKA